MLLINWHYINKQVIDFENINFLTGKNGSGKSTIIDALQLLILGDTRGNFFNRAANEKTERTLEGYLRGEIGDDGDVGYKYLRNDRFSSYVVCEFLDKTTRKNFCIGVVFDVFKEGDIEHHFFSFNGRIPENEFIGENDIPFSFNDLKSYLTRKYGVRNFEIYASNVQYQTALRGKLGGLNPKFFNLFKKAVTFTPINDIEKFIVEYVCDVKNKIDITSMQENIRQYNTLLKQVEIMNKQKEQLQEIENINNKYIDEVAKGREGNYLILRAEKENIANQIEYLEKQFEKKKLKRAETEQETSDSEKIKKELEEEITNLIITREKSDIKVKADKLNNRIEELNKNLDNIKNIKINDITQLRNNTLKWNACISKLYNIKNKVDISKIENLDAISDLIKYIDELNEDNLKDTDLNAISEININIENLANIGQEEYFARMKDFEEKQTAQNKLENDIEKLKQGINPYENELINFKSMLEIKLNERIGKEVKLEILADLLEIKDEKWQNAIEGYLNTQKKYLIVEEQYYNEASEIYRELAKSNEKIHSFGIIDTEKIKNEVSLNVDSNSLATEVITNNNQAKVYVDYLLGHVIKCETVEEMRKHKQSITADCMLYQGYVLRKINPRFYKYPVIGKNAIEKQKSIKENELLQIIEQIKEVKSIIDVMSSVKNMSKFESHFIMEFEKDIEELKKEKDYITERQNIQKELDSMDMFWLNTISEQIMQKQEEKGKIENKINANNKMIGILTEELKNIEEKDLPEYREELNTKINKINAEYDINWQENIGEKSYEIQALKKTPEKIRDTYLNQIRIIEKRKEDLKSELINRKSEFNSKYQMSYNIQDSDNREFTKHLKELNEIALPEYTEKIEDSRKKAYEQFRIEFLDKLKFNIDEVKKQIKELNSALGEHRFGTDSYSFKVSPKQEYKRFYDMLQDDLLLGDWFIGQEQFNQKYSQEIKELFDKITSKDINGGNVSSEEYEKNIKEYTDYRTYLNFDLIVRDRLGNEQRLSKTLLKKSGGETQTPFYISILASFAQVYRIKNNDNTIRLIVFDEAFSKMDSERIEESIKLLRKIGFQAIFAAPPEKLQDIQPLVDSTLLVINPEEHEIVIKKYTNKEAD